MKQRFFIALLLFVAVANSGCMWARNYNPAGRDTFLGFPGVFEWTISEERPSGKLKESLDAEAAEYERAARAKAAAQEIPLDVSVTDTP